MEQKECNNNFACFLAGMFAGATAALLMAPQAGRRTRRMLREGLDAGEQSVADAGHDLRRQGMRLAEGAASLADRAAHALSR
ncbi:MAG: YtxH domain-containing protein [Acidobacteria bacterium]|nr:YtxH domain-containing protein [Acidobacteriota bacterium]